ncbi:MAG: hypothetical protein JW937_00715 [Candidatus Omnitrophica bacterium]|nr:hypothetical protein [Candidatus Omnitrophota bacterium]
MKIDDISVQVGESSVPLRSLVRQLVKECAGEILDEQRASEMIEGLGNKWQGGTLILKPENVEQQAKEVPIETFFHKIVMVRNNLRVLEQKINSNDKLADAEKVELQQYITRSYGSLTTFNVLFKSKADHFKSS